MAHENVSELSDLDLFAGWRAGDRDKGKVFYRRLAPKIVRYFRRNILDVARIEELTHDTFLEAKRSTNAEVNNPQAYLFGIAANVLKKHIRERRKDLGRPDWQPENREDTLHSLDPAQDPEYIHQQRDEDRLLMKAMRRLPFPQQLVLELSFWENMTGREIAAALDIPEGTVRSRLRLGREALNALIVELQESPEQFRTATLSINTWQGQIQEYMVGLDPDRDKGS